MDVSDKISLEKSLEKSEGFNEILMHSKYPKLDLEEIFCDNDLILILLTVRRLLCSFIERNQYFFHRHREQHGNLRQQYFSRRQGGDYFEFIAIYQLLIKNIVRAQHG